MCFDQIVSKLENETTPIRKLGDDPVNSDRPQMVIECGVVFQSKGDFLFIIFHCPIHYL